MAVSFDRMNQRPKLPKTCPVCDIAMQATTTENGVVYRCQQCGLTINIARREFLSVWVQKSFSEWTTYGGGGYWINQDDNLGDKNYSFFGWLLQRKITDKLTLGGEIFHQTNRHHRCWRR